ncbi:MAG: cation transporter, partial [Candidatus Eremiobacteraeota bacterium]|nr:cation transporter [Candidatus Eremiobacteraeota bacterium]
MTSRTPLLIALAITIGIAALEFWGGYASHSLALTTDAIHVCVDTLAIALALVAAIGAARPPDRRRTFGYGRIEILGALVNGTILCVATVAIVMAAIHRFSAPEEPAGVLMTIVAAIGLVCNTAVGVVLHRAGENDLNVRAALFHVLGDALGAFAV